MIMCLDIVNLCACPVYFFFLCIQISGETGHQGEDSDVDHGDDLDVSDPKIPSEIGETPVNVFFFLLVY